MTSSRRLWYRQPALEWEQALPLGNGRLGALVYGGVRQEQIKLNEDTLWSGGPRDTAVADGGRTLAEIRRLILEEDDLPAAEELTKRLQGPFTQSYQPLGDLWLTMEHPAEATDYQRELRLDDACVSVRYRVGGVTYQRTTLVSAPHQALVVRLTADAPERISVDVRFDSLQHHTVSVEGDVLLVEGRAPWQVDPNYHGSDDEPVKVDTGPDGRGMRFAGILCGVADGGRVQAADGRLQIREADSVTLIWSSATSFQGWDREPGHDTAPLLARCHASVDAAASLPWAVLWAQHLAEYRARFWRASLDLGDPLYGDLPTDERLRASQEGPLDPDLVALYWDYGRYLLIASSRPGTQPANLQGIWSRSQRPPWSANYTLNINAEMNYWPAETCNLADCAEPLITMVEELAQSGRRTAEVLYGYRGWTAHHNSDLWRLSSPVGAGTGCPWWACWPMGGAWLCQNLWDHYAFSQDPSILARIYPILREAAAFVEDWLVADADGRLHTAPSTSPENRFLLEGDRLCGTTKDSAMDRAIVVDLLTHCIDAATTLGVDAELSRRWRTVLDSLCPYQVGPDGRLQEWDRPYPEPEPGHRHISHLYGVHPGHAITPQRTPHLAAAARRSLEHRLEHGSGHTGWSCAWIINQWARLGDASRAYAQVETLFRKSTYPNLWDAHPPFQIDGNFGATAGISEMLLQSHAGEIALLPALPEQWPTGSAQGLRARGGFVVDLAWTNGHLAEATLYARVGEECRLRTFEAIVVETQHGESLPLRDLGEGSVAFAALAGQRYHLRPRG